MSTQTTQARDAVIEAARAYVAALRTAGTVGTANPDATQAQEDEFIAAVEDLNEAEQTWLITFVEGGIDRNTGDNLDGRYVAYTGTHDEVRTWAVDRFGSHEISDMVPANTSYGQQVAADWSELRIEPDYWTRATAELHHVADQLATLAGNTGKPLSANLYLYCGHSFTDPAKTVPVVDAIASALGTTAKTKIEGRGNSRSAEHRLDVDCGPVSVIAYAQVPPPPTAAEKRTSRVADLERQLAEANAKLAQQQSAGGVQ